MLDTTNAPEGQVVRGLRRLVAELLLAECDPLWIKRALRMVQPMAWLDLRPVHDILWASTLELVWECILFDRFETTGRFVDSCLRARE